MGPFMGMARKAFDAAQSRVSQAVNMVKTAAQRGKDIALKVGRKVVDVTRKATTLLKEFTQSAIQKGRQTVQKAKQWSSQQIKKATEVGGRLVAQARKRVADLVPKGIRLAKEKAVTGIKQKLGGVRDRIKNFLQDKWNRLKEKLGIKKPGKEGSKGGAKETPDPAAKKAAELPAAIAQAKAITEVNDAADTPVPALIGLLNASVKSKYSWIKRFEARPKGTSGHYSIHMIASDHEVDPDYTTKDKKRKPITDPRIIDELALGDVRTPEELKRARDYFKNHKEKAKQRWEAKNNRKWPDDPPGSGVPARASHPRPLADGGHPMVVEPASGGSNTEHMIPDPVTGKTDQQRFGGRRSNKGK
jgi:hypothetical protein